MRKGVNKIEKHTNIFFIYYLFLYAPLALLLCVKILYVFIS